MSIGLQELIERNFIAVFIQICALYTNTNVCVFLNYIIDFGNPLAGSAGAKAVFVLIKFVDIFDKIDFWNDGLAGS